MKKAILLSIILGATVGFITNTVYTYPVLAEEKGNLPTVKLMSEIEKRTYNILTGILLGNYSQVKQETHAVVEEANKISTIFFPQNPDADAWYKRAKHVDENNKEALGKLKEEFAGYVKKIETTVREINKAADSKSQESALNAFEGLIKNSCLECHKNHRS